MFAADATLAGGDFEHATDGSTFDGETSATLARFLFEGTSRAGFGGGVSLEFMNSDDDLFVDQGFNATQASWVEVAPYFLYRIPGSERFRMPIRVGPWFHVLEGEDQVNGDTLTWNTFGIRLVAEPEIVVAQGDHFELSLFGGFSAGLGASVIDLESNVGDEEFDSEAASIGLELGPRFRWGAFSCGVSLLYRQISVDDSDPEGGVFVRGIESSFRGIAFTLGTRI